MSTKLKKTEGARPKFRPNFIIDDIAVAMKNPDPNYSYVGVIYDRGVHRNENPYDVEQHEAKGYEVVYSTERWTDDRKNSPDNSTEDHSVPKPCIKKTAQGETYVLMRILKTKEAENAKAESDENTKRYWNSTKRKGYRNAKGEIRVELNEINEGNKHLGDSEDV